MDGTASSTPARVISSASGSLSRSEPSAGAYDDEDGYYEDDRPLGRQRRVIQRQGKADKVPAWVGSGTERWQEYRASMCAWYYSNRDFLTEGQIISKLAEMFKSAGETAAADSLLGYSQLGSSVPPFQEILHDLDSLYKVNRIGNALDIVTDFSFKAPTAQAVIAKIEKMTKLVQGGKVNIRDILMAGAIRDNITPGSQIALVNTMAQQDHEGDRVRFTEFKSAFRQTFVATPPHSGAFGKGTGG